jgi:hypothetical protein
LQGSYLNQLWLSEKDQSLNSGGENLSAIISQDESFEKAISSQQTYIAKYIKDINSNPRPSWMQTSDSDCGPGQSSILVLNDDFYGFHNWGWHFFNGKNNDFTAQKFIVTYANDKMKGCDCEDHFDDLKDELKNSNMKTKLKGYYHRENNKLYFIQGKNQKIELVEQDKCNLSVESLLDKKIEISTSEKFDLKSKKIPYINSCKSRIEIK